MKVEATRSALFGSAHVDPKYADHFGNGKIAARDALDKPLPGQRICEISSRRPMTPNFQSYRR